MRKTGQGVLWDVVARKGQSNSDRTRSGPWLSGGCSLIRAPNVYDRETPRSIRTTLGSWGTDLAQIFHPIIIMPDAIDRARPYFSWANNSPDPHLETAPGSKTNLTDSSFGPTSSPTSRASASATRPPTSSTPLVLAITFPTGSYSVPKSGSTTPRRQGHRQRHEARKVHVLGRFDHPVLTNALLSGATSITGHVDRAVAPMLTMISVDFRSRDPRSWLKSPRDAAGPHPYRSTEHVQENV